MSVFEETKATAFKNERNAGNYGEGTKELQAKNYLKAKEVRTLLAPGPLSSPNQPLSDTTPARLSRARPFPGRLAL